MNLSDLQTNKSLGTPLTSEEERYVMQYVANDPEVTPGGIAIALGILGKTGNRKYRKVIDSWLRRSKDPLIAAVALRSLVRHLALASVYKTEVLSHCAGLPYDIHKFARFDALQLAADVFEKGLDLELLKILFQIFDAEEDEASPTKQEAYIGIAAALKVSWRDLSQDTERPFCFVIDHDLVERARQLATA